MYNNQIEYLSWDSDFFLKKIGRLLITDVNNLESFLKEAITNGYQLIYVFGDKEFFIDNDILLKYNGKLIDKKIVYEKRITEAERRLPTITMGINISEYINNELTEELEQLAYISGNYSRFKLDNNFKGNDFYRMYKIWMEKSIKHQIADNVFIATENKIIKGVVTLKKDGNKGNIGLISVSTDMQNKGYGKALILACENELWQKSIYKIEVATQAENIQACKFYEKSGFQIKEINNIYHFWL